MAKEDATEQAKEILRQIIKHRFWISIGFAALFAVIAYFMGSGPVKAKAADEMKKINDAEKGVQAYASTSKPTEQYKPIVVEKTEIADKDVKKAWKELYDRQAPLLTWPETVQDRFRKWGRKWPEDVDPTRVKLAIVDYIEAYPAYVDMVYNVFHPFNYETGKGIVAAPPKEALLRPAQLAVQNGIVPGLGKVWSAQERLWIQRTLLEVVAQVNKKATKWDDALIKQIDVLEVGNPIAQDQRSLAKGEQLTKAEDIRAPGEEAPAEGADAGGMGGGMGGMSGMGGMPAGGAAANMMRMMMSGGRQAGMGGGGTSSGAQYDDTIYYITPEGDKGQYKILPVSLTVLIDQEHVQDLLVELENSPMSIQVMDIDVERPASPVTKPEKGEQQAGFGMMGGMGMMMRGQAYGGMAAQMQGMMMGYRGMMGGMGRMGGEMGGMGRMGMMGMGGFGGGGARDERKKVDVSNINRKEEREKQQKALEESKGPSLFDPYYNIVQVTVYGQARFFNPPPADAEAPPSPGDTPASPGAADAAEKPAVSTTPAPAAGAAPAATEKATPGADAKAPASETGTPANPGAAKPVDAKPAADAAKPSVPAPAQPETKGAAAKP